MVSSITTTKHILECKAWHSLIEYNNATYPVEAKDCLYIHHVVQFSKSLQCNITAAQLAMTLMYMWTVLIILHQMC